MSAERDDGMTLIEMLVVMIIIAVLAAISVPAMVSQRNRAHDANTRQDARRLAQAVTTWFMEHSNAPAVGIVAGRYQVGGVDVGAVTEGTVVAGADPASVTTTGWTPAAWCLALAHPSGGAVRYSVAGGLESGTCSSPVAP
ncbi:MAG: prepilin-type N-terminal cleavage/methylation domain-containing protein [Kineosporiaceae bacterium]|nr:prepilin-type N-terminal cleavage/methylation domain-containing protein [Kineosporiaceae bacterium]